MRGAIKSNSAHGGARGTAGEPQRATVFTQTLITTEFPAPIAFLTVRPEICHNHKFYVVLDCGFYGSGFGPVLCTPLRVPGSDLRMGDRE